MRLDNKWIEGLATLPSYCVLIIALYKLKFIIWLVAAAVSLLILAIAYRVFIVKAVNKGYHPIAAIVMWWGGQVIIIGIIWYGHEILK